MTKPDQLCAGGQQLTSALAAVGSMQSVLMESVSVMGKMVGIT